MQNKDYILLCYEKAGNHRVGPSQAITDALLPASQSLSLTWWFGLPPVSEAIHTLGLQRFCTRVGGGG